MNQVNQSLSTIRRSPANFSLLSQAISIFVAGIGCLVLIGWAMDIEVFKSIVPGLASMKSMTALLFVVSGVSLWLYGKKQAQRIAQVCALLAALTGLLTLGEYFLHVDLGIDTLLFQDLTPGVLYPGRMSPATALSFLLTGCALLFTDRPSQRTFKEWAVVSAFAISVLALIGYLYGVSSLYRIGEFSSMALHTALSFALLSLGILFARAEEGIMHTILDDTAGGHILRRFLPTALVLPAFLGWFRLMGQRAGLYDTAFGLAIMVISLMTTLTVLIWVNAGQITELDRKRKQTDDSLRSSELRFQNILGSMMEGCQIVGYDWRFQYLNDTAVRHNHLPREKLLGQTMQECYPGFEQSALFTTLQTCMQERTPARTINEFVDPQGAREWYELSIEPTPEGVFILSSDITQRKQAEQALLEREMQLSKLFEILPIGISILDAERRITYSNPALTKILHLSEEDLQQGAYANRKYIGTDGMPMPVEEMASTLAFRENRQIDGVETGIQNEDGSTIWTSVSAVPVDVQDWKLVLVTVDITERKKAEQALRESEQKYSLLFDKSAVPAAMLKLPEVVIVDVNEALVKLVGYSRQEMLGRTVADLGIASSAARTREINKFDEQGSLSGSERYLTTKTGEQRIVLGNTNAISLGGVRYAVSTMQDITERKQAENEIIRINAELEEKVVQRTGELAAANERLHQLSILDELTGMYNRRGFLLLAEEQLMLARRTKSNLVIFYADLDGLKKINDQQGHAAGDRAIITAAQALARTFRASDIKARLGGDEFIVLAIDCDPGDVPLLLTRLRQGLARQNLSISVGTTTIEIQDEITLEDLVVRADRSMYEMKMSKPGRQRR
jgi:diguanylate cyclase (GGDEF)-like protein/PAS domain S-box-containing protein